MAFQKSWGWKGMAARLLLVPVLAGTAHTAAAQSPGGFGSSSTGTVGAAVANAEKARALLAQAKKALDAGDGATAEALAKQAADLKPNLSYSETRPETILAAVAAKPARGAAPTTAASRQMPAAKPVAATAAPTGEPKELLRQGQLALAAGRLDQAQDLAAQANQAAVGKGYKWGLFEDTPNGLMKDIQTARSKSDKTQAAELYKKAKALLIAPGKTEAEQVQNLDQALNMAYQAKNLHGPYSLWDFSDKPDDLIAAIEAKKAVARRTAPAVPDAVAKKPAAPTGVQTAGGRAPTTPPKLAAGATKWNDPSVVQAVGKGQLPPPTLTPSETPTIPVVAKVDTPSVPATPTMPEVSAAPSLTITPPAAPTLAIAPPAITVPDLKAPTTPADSPVRVAVAKLVAEGRTLLGQNKVLEARSKADEARKLLAANPLVSMATGEDTPDELFQAVQAKGGQALMALTNKADELAAKGGTADAKVALDQADKLAAGLGLYAKPIADRKAKMGMTAAAPPAIAAPTIAIATPTIPSGEVLVPAESVPASALPPAVAPGVRPSGSALLAQAEAELKRNELDMAKRIAMQVFNGTDTAAKTQAQALLRSIDAAETEAKKTEAAAALKAAAAAHGSKQYDNALAIANRINPAYLSAEQKAAVQGMMTDCLDKTKPATDVTLAQATEPAKPAAPKSTAADEQRAMADVAFQKLRQDGIDAMTAAASAWGRGETDAAVRTLEEYEAKVKASGQPAGRQANLLSPIENRLRGYAGLKHTVDVLAREKNEKDASRREQLAGRVAEVQKQDEIKKKVAEVHGLMKAKKHKEAESLALQAKSLDPDDPTLKAMYEIAKTNARKEQYDRIRDEQEELFRGGLNVAETQGPLVDTQNPVALNPEAMRRAQSRGEAGLYQRARTPEEFKIERELSTPYSLDANGKSLRDVLTSIRSDRRLNMVTDDVALDEEKISLDQVQISEKLTDLPLRDVLTILLQKARMAYVVENNVVKLTTVKRSSGRMTTKVFHVMDLVTPIPEFGLSPHHTIAGAIAETKKLPVGAGGQLQGGSTPFAGKNDLAGAQLVSGGQPGMAGTQGQLQNPGMGNQPAMGTQREVYARQLKKLVTGMVRPMAWQDQGGAGNIEYYDIGGAMVVNQTADVINEVQNLLDSLRRLQDLSVAVEIRVISLSEAFFERVGVDFNLNVKTNNTSFERQLATSSFRPEPFLNDINVNGATVGYSPATGFSNDLDVPIRATSYGLSLPPFGGYQGALSPTLNGGLSLGLAFLNDIQVYMFLEAAQGNRRVNVMQAPKITLFNGQTSTVFVGDVAFFTTSLQVFNSGGQFVYLPTNVSFPIGNGINPNGGATSGVSVTVQAIISSDRRFVRLNLSPTLTALASATVPLFPITTFITPVFEGGSQGQPIPFTQFFQQPSFTEIAAQTTVAVPDGGTVLLGGLKTLSQGRNEFGPPVLSQVPYLNRLFKNVGIGQDTRHVMLMVTPRIIINSEEEVRQTQDGLGGLAPQP